MTTTHIMNSAADGTEHTNFTQEAWKTPKAEYQYKEINNQLKPAYQ